MHEKREFFRLKNNGEIEAKYGSHKLDIVEISSTGVAIIKKNVYIQEAGEIEFIINHVDINIKYELLRVELKTMVLVFKNKEDIEKLFMVLKKIKDSHK